MINNLKSHDGSVGTLAHTFFFLSFVLDDIAGDNSESSKTKYYSPLAFFFSAN